MERVAAIWRDTSISRLPFQTLVRSLAGIGSLHREQVKRSDSEKIAAVAVDLLAEVRRNSRMSYEDLGGLTGLHATSISLIERHMRQPTFVNLCRIARALNVRLSTIVRKAEEQVRKRD